MEYAFSKKIDKSFDGAIQHVTEALKKEGFGIISEIDLKEKFKEKLDVDYSNYKILGACNPAMAHKAVQVEDKIGVMLPCNVVVHETQNGEVEVAAVNPLNSIGVVGNEALKPIADEIAGKLRKVVEGL